MNRSAGGVSMQPAPLYTMKKSTALLHPSRRSILSWPLGLILPKWANAQVDGLAILGKDNYIFAGWGNEATPDWKGIEASIDRIAKVHALLAVRGVALIVPVIPDKMRFYEDKLPDGRSVTSEMRSRYSGTLKRMRGERISVVDCDAALRAVAAAGQPVYYRTDQHWTQPAVDAAAEATAGLIRALVPTLPGQVGTGLALGTISKERRYGDLADRFLSSEQRKAVGKEVFTVRRESESSSLLGDAPAPVHVTGNSMVQPYFGFPQKLSNLIDRPVTVNWKPGDVGFWRVLIEYLESDSFRKQPPQVLVWQLFEANFHLGPDARGLWDNASLISEADWNRRIQAALAA